MSGTFQKKNLNELIEGMAPKKEKPPYVQFIGRLKNGRRVKHRGLRTKFRLAVAKRQHAMQQIQAQLDAPVKSRHKKKIVIAATIAALVALFIIGKIMGDT